MRAYSWVYLAALAMACSGSAFSTQGGDGGAGNGNESGSSSIRAGSTSGGLSGKGGKASGGSANAGDSSEGGTDGNGGLIGVGGKVGIAGALTFGGTQGVAGGGVGPDPVDKVCPVDMPTPQGACEPGLSCSYGSHLLASCRSRATCAADGWVIEAVTCPELHGCNNIVGGASCNPETSPACVIGNDRDIYCVCTGCTGAGPCSDNTVWKCAGGSGGPACPKVLPNQGQACPFDTECSYGSCTTGESMSAVCSGTTWEWESNQCPQ